MRIVTNNWEVKLDDTGLRLMLPGHGYRLCSASPTDDDPQMVKAVREKFLGKPETAATAFDIAKFLLDWKPRRPAEMPGDWGKEAWFRDNWHKGWTGPYTIAGQNPEGKWYDGDGYSWDKCEVEE